MGPGVTGHAIDGAAHLGVMSDEDKAMTAETVALTDEERESLKRLVKSWLPVSHGSLLPRLEAWLCDRIAEHVAAAKSGQQASATTGSVFNGWSGSEIVWARPNRPDWSSEEHRRICYCPDRGDDHHLSGEPGCRSYRSGGDLDG